MATDQPPRRRAIYGDTFHDPSHEGYYVKQARLWTADQAARLDRTPEEILAAVRRGWLPEDIEGVESKYHLEDGPPLMAEMVEAIERIRQAPILPPRCAGAAGILLSRDL